MGITWTDEKVDFLKEIWAAKNSAEVCAHLLHKRFADIRDIPSRSAILGKVHRLQLEARNTVATAHGRAPRRKITARQAQARKPKAKPQLSASQRQALADSIPTRHCDMAPAGPRPEGTPLSDLGTHDCHWVMGDPRHTIYCGKKALPGFAYCAEHCEKMFGWEPGCRSAFGRAYAEAKAEMTEREDA